MNIPGPSRNVRINPKGSHRRSGIGVQVYRATSINNFGGQKKEAPVKWCDQSQLNPKQGGNNYEDNNNTRLYKKYNKYYCISDMINYIY